MKTYSSISRLPVFMHAKKTLAMLTSAALVAFAGNLTSCKKTPAHEPPKDKIVSITGDATDITASSATIHGSTTIPSHIVGTPEMGIIYSIDENIPLASSTIVKADNADSENKYSISLTVLSPSTTYYYKSYVSHKGEYIYGTTKSFKTADLLVSKIVLNNTALNIAQGSTVKLDIEITPEEASDKSVKWSSTNTAAATVDDTGLVTGVAKGEATIKVEAKDGGGAFAECKVSVTELHSSDIEAVDLGLSVKWASCNVGATKPEEYGDHFSWGETQPKEKYIWATYKWGTGPNFTKYNETDNKTVLDLEDDAAHVNWGGQWRMATDAEWEELRKNCEAVSTSLNGVKGWLFTSKKEGYTDKSIFLSNVGYSNENVTHARPNAYYWSSTRGNNRDAIGWWYFENFSRTESYRYMGYGVRAVQPKK